LGVEIRELGHVSKDLVAMDIKEQGRYVFVTLEGF